MSNILGLLKPQKTPKRKRHPKINGGRIRRLASGQYQADLSYRGKRQKQSFATRDAAAAWLAEKVFHEGIERGIDLGAADYIDARPHQIRRPSDRNKRLAAERNKRKAERANIIALAVPTILYWRLYRVAKQRGASFEAPGRPSKRGRDAIICGHIAEMMEEVCARAGSTGDIVLDEPEVARVAPKERF